MSKRKYVDEEERMICDQQRLWIRFQREYGVKISRSLFAQIIREGNRLKGEAIVEPGGYRTEFGGSLMYIHKYKSKKMYMDFKASKEHNTFVPYINDHTFGYNFCFKWSNYDDSIRNMRLLVFEPFREMKAKLKVKLRSGQTNYSELKRSEEREIKKLEKLIKKTTRSGENNRSSEYYI